MIYWNHLQNWKKGGVSQKILANNSKATETQSKTSVCVHNYPKIESLEILMKYGMDKCRDRKTAEHDGKEHFGMPYLSTVDISGLCLG